jgi:dTDP-4-amino-4,6-dideoxygalactose transaminase
MDYNKMESLINDKTKAIIPVDMAGVPCDYDALYSLIDEKKNLFNPKTEEQKMIGRIAVISDSAHSINCDGCGRNADFTALSFHAIKNITTGEGGALLFDYPAYEKIKLLADHGQTAKTNYCWYDISVLGQNHIMTNPTAAFGISQFKRIDEITRKRVELTKKYIDCIGEAGEVLYKNGSACHLLMVQLKENVDRDRVIMKMHEKGVSVNIHYIPLPMMSAYKNIGFDISDYPNAYKMYKKEISLPLYYDLDLEDAEYISNCLRECVYE